MLPKSQLRRTIYIQLSLIYYYKILKLKLIAIYIIIFIKVGLSLILELFLIYLRLLSSKLYYFQSSSLYSKKSSSISNLALVLDISYPILKLNRQDSIMSDYKYYRSFASYRDYSSTLRLENYRDIQYLEFRFSLRQLR